MKGNYEGVYLENLLYTCGIKDRHIWEIISKMNRNKSAYEYWPDSECVL
jgi:hypothetical protein